MVLSGRIRPLSNRNNLEWGGPIGKDLTFVESQCCGVRWSNREGFGLSECNILPLLVVFWPWFWSFVMALFLDLKESGVC